MDFSLCAIHIKTIHERDKYTRFLPKKIVRLKKVKKSPFGIAVGWGCISVWSLSGEDTRTIVQREDFNMLPDSRANLLQVTRCHISCRTAEQPHTPLSASSYLALARRLFLAFTFALYISRQLCRCMQVTHPIVIKSQEYQYRLERIPFVTLFRKMYYFDYWKLAKFGKIPKGVNFIWRWNLRRDMKRVQRLKKYKSSAKSAWKI